MAILVLGRLGGEILEKRSAHGDLVFAQLGGEK